MLRVASQRVSSVARTRWSSSFSSQSSPAVLSGAHSHCANGRDSASSSPSSRSIIFSPSFVSSQRFIALVRGPFNFLPLSFRFRVCVYFLFFLLNPEHLIDLINCDFNCTNFRLANNGIFIVLILI